MKGILAGLVILVVGSLAVNCYLADIKVKESAKQIVVLNDLIKEKDAAISKLIGERDSKEQELNILRRELDSVKTTLSNTVLKLQAQTPPAPVQAPVKTSVKK